MVSRRARSHGYREAQRLVRLFFNTEIPREYRLRYIEEAYKILLKIRGEKPAPLKLFRCKYCGSPLHPGVNAVYRVRPRPYLHVAVKCLVCGKTYRKGFKSTARR